LVDTAVGIRPGLRALIASGYAETAAPVGSASQHVHMLAKPFRQSELARVLREILDR
jgi:hypothetical protein